MSAPMDDFATGGDITEVCYVLPCGLYFNVLIVFLKYQCMNPYIHT